VTLETSTGARSRATVSVLVNSVPVGGSCSVNPSSGIATVTRFSISCQDWVDDEPPIRYKFQVMPGDVWLDVSGFQTNPSHSIIFPSVFSTSVNASASLPVRTIIRDALGAESTLELAAAITTPSTSFDQLIGLVSVQSSGDLSTAAVLLIEAIEVTRRDEADGKIGVVQAQDQKTLLLRQISDLVDEAAILGSNETLSNPAEFLNLLTAPVTLPSGEISTLNETNINSTLTIVEKMINPLDSLVDVPSASNSLFGTLTNLLIIPGNSQTANGASNDPVQTSVIEGLLLDLISATISNNVPGEDGLDIQVNNVTINGKRVSNEKITSGTVMLSSPTGGEVIITNLTQVTVDPVDVLSIYWSSPIFPGNTTTGTKTVTLREPDSRSNIPIVDAFPPITIGIPVFNNNTLSCGFWNISATEYQTRGVSFQGEMLAPNTSDFETYAACESTHLTSFSGLGVEASGGINTFEEEDIREADFSYRSPAVVFGIVLFAMYLVGLPFACKLDNQRRLIFDSYKETAKFWKEIHSRSSGMIFQTRGFSLFQNNFFFGIRNHHLWLAIFNHHPGDFYSSWKRWTALFTVLFSVASLDMENHKHFQIIF